MKRSTFTEESSSGLSKVCEEVCSKFAGLAVGLAFVTLASTVYQLSRIDLVERVKGQEEAVEVAREFSRSGYLALDKRLAGELYLYKYLERKYLF